MHKRIRRQSSPKSCKYICELNPSIDNQECFNYILKFKQKDFLLNSIASNKNEDFLIQYNEYMNYFLLDFFMEKQIVGNIFFQIDLLLLVNLT